jgi:hypothetical protein
LGVAAVATLVLLSGCEPLEQDYVEALKGTWVAMGKATEVSADLDGNEERDSRPYPATTDVEVTITEGNKLNTGRIKVTVQHTIKPGDPGPEDPLELPLITVTGSFVATSASKFDVTIDDIDTGDPSSPGAFPDRVTLPEGKPIPVIYEVSDDTLELSSELVRDLETATSRTPLTLTKN